LPEVALDRPQEIVQKVEVFFSVHYSLVCFICSKPLKADFYKIIFVLSKKKGFSDHMFVTFDAARQQRQRNASR